MLTLATVLAIGSLAGLYWLLLRRADVRAPQHSDATRARLALLAERTARRRARARKD